MSDTTNTITPEERARAKENSDALTAAYMSGKYDGLKEAESNVARLTKMVDWLAGQHDVICPQEKCHATGGCIDCWKEAARRAVADAESEVDA